MDKYANKWNHFEIKASKLFEKIPNNIILVWNIFNTFYLNCFFCFFNDADRWCLQPFSISLTTPVLHINEFKRLKLSWTRWVVLTRSLRNLRVVLSHCCVFIFGSAVMCQGVEGNIHWVTAEEGKHLAVVMAADIVIFSNKINNK